MKHIIVTVGAAELVGLPRRLTCGLESGSGSLTCGLESGSGSRERHGTAGPPATEPPSHPGTAAHRAHAFYRRSTVPEGTYYS